MLYLDLMSRIKCFGHQRCYLSIGIKKTCNFLNSINRMYDNVNKKFDSIKSKVVDVHSRSFHLLN